MSTKRWPSALSSDAASAERGTSALAISLSIMPWSSSPTGDSPVARWSTSDFSRRL